MITKEKDIIALLAEAWLQFVIDEMKQEEAANSAKEAS